MFKPKLRILFASFIFSLLACQFDSETHTGPMGFTLMGAEKTGVTFSNNITETMEENIYYSAYMFNGGGVATADFNNDGLIDLYFTANQTADKLYLNKGNFKFEDISQSSGISKFKGWKNGVSIVDINGDGLMDIYVCRGDHNQTTLDNHNLLYINQGDLTFLESAATYGIDDPGYSICAVFFDMDNDLDLDLYVSNRPERSYNSYQQLENEKKLNINACHHRLYRNNGDNTFKEVTAEAGMHSTYAYGLNVIAGDFNEDGWQDLYICQDFRWPDIYYENQRDGTFKEKIKDLVNHTSFSSMGADLGDINNDGLEDFFILDMRPEDYKRSKTSMPVMNTVAYDSMVLLGFHIQYMHNALLLNRGKGYFSEISQLSGLDKSDWSWAPLLADFDHDGLKDIYSTNGYRRDLNDLDGDSFLDSLFKNNHRFNSLDELFQLFPTVQIANYMFRNEGNYQFKKVINEWGFNHPSYSNGASIADLDNDGDLDIIVNNLDQVAFIYRNDNPNPKKQIRVSCKGPKSNQLGIGSKINFFGKSFMTSAEIRIQRGYLSCSEPVAHFGMGNEQFADSISIVWPDGKNQVIYNIRKGSKVIFDYEKAKHVAPIKAAKEKPHFVDVTDISLKPVFYHKENEYDDFKIQILLPYRTSKMGPMVAVGDVNGDDHDDFFVGGAKHQSGELYLQNGSGQFEKNFQKSFESDKEYEDIGSAFFDADQDGDLDLYIVSGGSESPEGSAYQDRLYLNDGKGQLVKASKSIPITKSSGAAIVPFDWDGDGDLDLFRPGRLVPLKYPSAPETYFFRNDGNGIFSDQSKSVLGPLRFEGMITSAVPIDVNGDQKTDLVVAGEWMNIQVWENQGSNFMNTDPTIYGLQNTEGWWLNLHLTDLNNDGKQDLVCGNIGENFKFHASVEKPFSIYANDFDRNKSFDIVLAKYVGDSEMPVRGKQCSQEQMPFIKTKFPKFRQFADANLYDIYGEELKSSIHLKAKEFRSIILWNKGGKFEKEILPAEAQFSAVTGIVTSDLNGDNNKDIILSGNLCKTEVETTPVDASVGLVLLSNGKKFSPLTIAQSGVFLKTDTKDMKPIIIGQRFGLVSSSNNGPLKILVKQ